MIDPLTFEVTLPKPDKLALPNLATVYPIIINSKVAKEHATPDDPWATAWLKENTAGSGAYKIETFKPGEQVIMTRNEAWNRGTADKSAFFKRVIVQSVPEPATRANLVERGDADLVIDLQASDVQSLEAKGKLKVISTPQYNAVTFVSMNNQIPPFDNINVRRAIAFALPYDDMFKAALFGRGAPLFGATWADGKPTSGAYPIPQPVKLDLDKAKEYLKAAGMPDGFSTTFSFNVGQASTAEPMAALVKESLAKIGIKVDIQKLPDAQMSTQINEKKLPFFTEGIVAWLPSTDYFYRNFYTGNQRWNYSSINNPELVAIAQEARFETDKAKYEEDGKKLNAIHFERDAADTALAAQPGRGDGAVDRRLYLPVPPPGRLSRSQPQVTGRHDGGLWRNGNAGGQAVPVLASGAVRRAGLHLPADAGAAGRSGGVLCLRAKFRQGGDRGHPQADGPRQADARTTDALSLRCRPRQSRPLDDDRAVGHEGPARAAAGLAGAHLHRTADRAGVGGAARRAGGVEAGLRHRPRRAIFLRARRLRADLRFGPAC